MSAQIEILNKPKTMTSKFRWLLFCCLLLVFPLAACSQEMASVEIVGYNHTDHSIGSFGVNGYGSIFQGRHSGGGKFTCCVNVPLKYKPGMSVKIDWTDEKGENPQVRTVLVPPYLPKATSTLAVHFLKGGEIKVFVTKYGLGHPDYPLKGEGDEP